MEGYTAVSYTHLDAYVAPENYAQEGTPVREGKGGFTAVANGSTPVSYTHLVCGSYAQIWAEI